MGSLLLRKSSIYSFAGRKTKGLRSFLGLRENRGHKTFTEAISDKNGTIAVDVIVGELGQLGIHLNDVRLKSFKRKYEELRRGDGRGIIDEANFKCVFAEDYHLMESFYKNKLVIPDFRMFCDQVTRLYHSCKNVKTGRLATYIPLLGNADPDNWGISVCTVSGQRFSIGDSKVPFTMQSTIKPLLYALCSSTVGPEAVHRYVNHEPSGFHFDEIVLDTGRRPHNPMINAGCLVITSLLYPDLSVDQRFDRVKAELMKLAPNEFVSFSEAMYTSERETSMRNRALAHFLAEFRCFPPNTNIDELLDFYFRLCSLEVTCDSLSMMAASMALGGSCPTMPERPVLDPLVIQDTLSLMLSAGMNSYSGQFAFRVGLPAKSGVAGGIMLVVPGVCGIGLWSPLLDQQSNSARGVQFCQELVNTFPLHIYDPGNLQRSGYGPDPRNNAWKRVADVIAQLLFAAASGNVSELKRFHLSGINLALSNYDQRTALHVAAADGHANVVQFLVDDCGLPKSPRDRWGITPLDDARSFQRLNVIDFLDPDCATKHETTDSSLDI